MQTQEMNGGSDMTYSVNANDISGKGRLTEAAAVALAA
jgi:hypothetical protein